MLTKVGMNHHSPSELEALSGLGPARFVCPTASPPAVRRRRLLPEVRVLQEELARDWPRLHGRLRVGRDLPGLEAGRRGEGSSADLWARGRLPARGEVQVDVVVHLT